ncbi:hypothetical protein AB0M45_13920 [Nocardia sp. NPDC051787]|uniref:hypothetical protein n=1 Tax=Nocardia sp. NPDC051787 TaxID=3155415 RepID=UPI003414D45B
MLYEILAEPEVVEFLYRLDAASRAAADHRAGLLAELGPQLAGEIRAENLRNRT